jgi:hypothetical protein
VLRVQPTALSVPAPQQHASRVTAPGDISITVVGVACLEPLLLRR